MNLKDWPKEQSLDHRKTVLGVISDAQLQQTRLYIGSGELKFLHVQLTPKTR